MAENLTPSFYRRLTSDGLIRALLSRYNGLPAVFTARPVPGDVEYPWIICDGSNEYGNFTVDALAGNLEFRLIEIFDDLLSSQARVELIANRVRNLFTWSSLAENGFYEYQSKASPPIRSTNDYAQGRVIRVQLFKSGVDAGTVGFEDYEVPVELPNGVITAFSTTRAFLAGSLMVWANYPQRPGVDFVEDGDLQGFTMAVAPAAGTDLWVSYRY
jgi:hypothetical protein